MPCLPEDDLIAYATGSVDDPARSRIESHLSDCSECRSIVAALAAAEPDAPWSVTELARPAQPSGTPWRPGGVVGSRYMIEGELGAGGMGVVYAAFDRELERRVALKLLRDSASQLGGQRLLREARAMARLTHPNVVSVYEVGSADGHDYIAMELVDGGSLATWLRAGARSTHEIVEAFMAAGRGLAAAHDAGVVHRDFKPQNVLCGRGGRIVVTDFGLARDGGAPSAPRATPTSLSVLTVPGSLAGTPAYMAPEQWTAGEVSPATDQFSFCVALWEALAGSRPYRASTLEELRDVVLQGPARLDTTRVPRRFRSLLLRGLAVEPSQRWPSMHDLLHAFPRRAPRARFAVLAVASAAALTAGSLWLAAGDSQPATAQVDSCEPPALSPEAAWPADSERTIRGGSPAAADRLARTVERWREVRKQVCDTRGTTRAAKLTCLDKIIVRVDALRRARLLDPSAPIWGVIAQLYEPEVCLREQPPRLPDRYSEAAVVGLALRSGAKLADDVIAAARAAAPADVCARSYLAFPQIAAGNPGAATEARVAAEACGDDQALGAAMMNVIRQRTTGFSDPELATSLRETAAVVERSAHPFLARQLARFRATQAIVDDDFDRAVELLSDSSDDDPPEFQLSRALYRWVALLARGTSADLERVARETSPPYPAWAREPTTQDVLVMANATARWHQGDVVAAHPILVEVAARLLANASRPTDAAVEGRVVDDRGAPVAGATVAAGAALEGDAVGIAVPLYSLEEFVPTIHRATTGPDGRFALRGASPTDLVLAESGGRRSGAQRLRDGVRLVVSPTRSVRGTVALEHGHDQAWVEARVGTQDYRIVAPIKPDGTYELAGLSYAAWRLRVAEARGSAVRYGPAYVVTAGPRSHTKIALSPPPARTATVIVRSLAAAPVDGAVVAVFPGDVAVRNVAELTALAKRGASAHALARAVVPPVDAAIERLVRPGDVVANVRGVGGAPATICAHAVNVDTRDPDFWTKYWRHASIQPVRCTRLVDGAAATVVEVPPMRRYPP